MARKPSLPIISTVAAACRLGPQAGLLLLALTVVASAIGCRSSQQASIPNPFLSADRVPAPPSRIPPAGAALPYYPNDAMPPLPAAQPIPQQSLQPLSALPPSNDITPIPADAAFTATGPAPPTSSLAANEPVVQIPSDERDLRFAALPPPMPAPQVVATTQSAPLTAATSPGFTQPSVTYVAQQQPAVPPATPTLYRQPQSLPPTAPVISNWPPVAAPEPQVTLSPVSDGGSTAGMFRDPSIPAQAPPLIQQAAPLEPTSTPRIRVPDAGQRVREDVVPGAIHTTSYQVGLAGGGVQTMVVPPPGYVPASFSTQGDVQLPAGGDGFQPRGTSQRSPETAPRDPSLATLRVTPG